MRRGSRTVGLTVLLGSLALVLVGACSPMGVAEKPRGVIIRNDLDETVKLVYDGAPRGRIEAHRDVILQPDDAGSASAAGCTTVDIVVFALDDRELVRIPPPACLDQSVTLSEWMSH